MHFSFFVLITRKLHLHLRFSIFFLLDFLAGCNGKGVIGLAPLHSCNFGTTLLRFTITLRLHLHFSMFSELNKSLHLHLHFSIFELEM